MHLKSLTLRGFKSFADRSVLSVEPGVTVIVGPNGSGKSNVSDAVLWVLGEQSAKTLRGQAMEDVIFSGSSARQAAGVAEVNLVLDNNDATLPLEFTDVTITRRMYRNGESEYLINQAPARLMDVQELLHDSGLGRDTHSIISQGRLEEILNSRPEDRRALIEEAAGILKHKRRKDRATRRLAGMDAYLERAKDIATEIDRQLRPLQRQAGRASQHAGLVSDLRDAELDLAVDDLRQLQGAWENIAKSEKEADAEIDLLRYRLSEKERDLSKFQGLLEEKGLFVGDLSEQRRRMQVILERLDAGLLLLEEKGKNLVDRLSDLRAAVHHSETRIASRGGELERLTTERSETDARLKALYSQLSELRRDSEAVRKTRIAADEELAHVTAATRRARKELDDSRLEHAALERQLSAFALEESLLQDRVRQIAEQRATAQETLVARRGRLEQLQSQLTHDRKELTLADGDVDKRVRVLDTRRRELDGRREDLGAVRAEARGLEEVDRAFESATPALSWLLAKERGLQGVIGPLADAIRAPKDQEALVERLLGSDLFAVLVDTTASASAIAKQITDVVEGELSLVPLDGAHPAPVTDGPGKRLVDLLEYEPAHRNAIESLLGDVFVVPDLDAALAASRKAPGSLRFATPDGTVVWPSGKVTVGTQLADAEGVLARKRRINELHAEHALLESNLGEAEAAVAEAEDALNAAQQDAFELSQRIAALTGEHDSLREEVGRLEAAVTSLDAEARAVDERLGDVRDRTAKERPDLASLENAITAHEAELVQLEEDAAVAREGRDARFREEGAVSERLSACQVEIATVSEREIHLKRQVMSITSELKELQETLAASRVTEEALELLRGRIEPLHASYMLLHERAEHWAAKLKDRAHFEQADSESLRETIHGAQDGVRSVQAEIEQASESMADLRVEKGQLEVQVSQAVRRIVEELGVPVESALERSAIADRTAAEDKVHRLRKQIANLGPVNPVAVEEFQALSTRREFITDQVADLEASRKSLQKVIAAIDRKLRDRFLQTFEDVDSQFQQIFGVLFPGGSAQLSLTDPDDPETTGVEVIAQPRGKKLAKLSLLSGGEKSLTSLALLFAVYRTRPCPFYILDEVEAALDDTNLRRFIAFVDSMRVHTQFLVVTHQRRTMEMADLLYGVSMQADGVSKVVSQKLDRTKAGETAVDEHAVV